MLTPEAGMIYVGIGMFFGFYLASKQSNFFLKAIFAFVGVGFWPFFLVLKIMGVKF